MNVIVASAKYVCRLAYVGTDDCLLINERIVLWLLGKVAEVVDKICWSYN